MYKFLRPLLFALSKKDPETAHNLALAFLTVAGVPPFNFLLKLLTKVTDSGLKQKVFGLEFGNPVGLAGGFDKNGTAAQGLEALGFGFLELGTVTQHAQAGNPRPRLFRLDKDQALINRMGFNNKGSDFLSSVLPLSHSQVPIGVSIGKSKITELEKSAADYLYSFQKLYEKADYFVVNISSPNTPGLRQLQEREALVEILSALNNHRFAQKIRKPILIKVVIDFGFEAIDEILKVCKSQSIDGIICSNTSLIRDNLQTGISEAGGLSGTPIKELSTKMIRYIHKQYPELPIIGVGGIFTAEDAYEKIKAGASLIQIYTGFIYEGPFAAKRINLGLIKLLAHDGFSNVSEATGVDSH